MEKTYHHLRTLIEGYIRTHPELDMSKGITPDIFFAAIDDRAHHGGVDPDNKSILFWESPETEHDKGVLVIEREIKVWGHLELYYGKIKVAGFCPILRVGYQVARRMEGLRDGKVCGSWDCVPEGFLSPFLADLEKDMGIQPVPSVPGVQMVETEVQRVGYTGFLKRAANFFAFNRG